MPKKKSTEPLKYNPERFREVLGLIKVSQTDLAQELGVTQPSIAAISSGKLKDIPVALREHLRNKYKVNPDYFYNLPNEAYLTYTNEILQKKVAILEKELKKANQIIELQFREIERLRKKMK